MSNSILAPESAISQPRFLWFLILSYAMAIALVNWFDARMICIFSIETDAGALIFPFTFLLSDLITEVYGYKQARLAIWSGLFFNFFYIGYGQLITLFPSPAHLAVHNADFDALMRLNIRVILASTLTYLVSEPLNSYSMAKLKIKFKGRYMGIRFLTASALSSAVDSLLFGAMAFSGIMPIQELIALIITMWLIKVSTEFFGIPLSVYLAKRLKKIEQLDIYDQTTRFGVFSLDTTYTPLQNKFYTSKTPSFISNTSK